MPKGVEHGYDPANPLIVQGDRSVLVEVDNPRYTEARDTLAPFADLEKSPEHIHTYRLTPLSLWNAAAAGLSARAMLDVLARYSKFPLPSNLTAEITELVSRYGRVRIERAAEAAADGTPYLRVVCADRPLLEELARQPRLRDYLGERLDAASFRVDPAHRGVLKQALIAVGYPAEDVAGYTEGAALPVRLRQVARSGVPFRVRDY
jgi:DNA excision repair protein ERCC-3